jgi:hypothetical protein
MLLKVRYGNPTTATCLWLPDEMIRRRRNEESSSITRSELL